MTLAWALLTTMAFLSSVCAVLLASRTTAISREMVRSTQEWASRESTASREAMAQAARDLQTAALGSQEMARSGTQAAMEAARHMVEAVTSTIFPVGSTPPPSDSDRAELERRMALASEQPWENVRFGVDDREAEEEASLSRTWPRAQAPAAAGMPAPMEPPAGWSERPPPPPLADDDPVAAAERYHRDRYFDPTPPG